MSKLSECVHGEQRNGRRSVASELGHTRHISKACVPAVVHCSIHLQPSTMDSSNSDREFVAKIGYTDAPEAGSGRMPGFSAINAAGDADGRRTTVAPSATVAPGLENARQQSGMPHLFFRICRSTSAKRALILRRRSFCGVAHAGCQNS